MTTRYIMPRIFIVAPSAYFGQRVKILRSKCAQAVNAVGTVTIHNTERGTLCVETDNGQAVWTHVSNVELIQTNESEKK